MLTHGANLILFLQDGFQHEVSPVIVRECQSVVEVGEGNVVGRVLDRACVRVPLIDGHVVVRDQLFELVHDLILVLTDHTDLFNGYHLCSGCPLVPTTRDRGFVDQFGVPMPEHGSHQLVEEGFATALTTLEQGCPANLLTGKLHIVSHPVEQNAAVLGVGNQQLHVLVDDGSGLFGTLGGGGGEVRPVGVHVPKSFLLGVNLPWLRRGVAVARHTLNLVQVQSEVLGEHDRLCLGCWVGVVITLISHQLAPVHVIERLGLDLLGGPVVEKLIGGCDITPALEPPWHLGAVLVSILDGREQLEPSEVFTQDRDANVQLELLGLSGHGIEQSLFLGQRQHHGCHDLLKRDCGQVGKGSSFFPYPTEDRGE